MKSSIIKFICATLTFTLLHFTSFGQVWFKTFSMPSSSEVNQIKASNDLLYIASDSGLHTFSEEGIWNTYKQADSLILNDVKSIGISESQVRLGLSDRQIAVLKDTTWSTFQFSESLSFSHCSWIQNLDGFWYYGTDAGQAYFQFDTLTINRADGYPLGTVTGLSETSSKFFIVLSSNGIFLDISGTPIYLTESNSQLPSSNVLCGIVHADVAYDGTDNGLYVADFNVGPPPSVQTFNTGNSLLPSNRIQALEAEGQTIWIGTDKGLVRWNGPNEAEVFDTDNSNIPSNDVRHIAFTDNSLWIATGDGRISFTQRIAGVSETDKESTMKVYPNPVSGMLHLSMPEQSKDQPLEGYILNDKGQVVKEFSGEFVDVSDLSAGTYYVRAKSISTHLTIPVPVIRSE